MGLWSFTHNTLGIDVYAFFSLLILLVMVVLGVWFLIKQRNKEEKRDEELCAIRAELSEAKKFDNNDKTGVEEII